MTINTPVVYIAILLIFSGYKSNGQYIMQEWERKVGEADSSIISISKYNSFNQEIEKVEYNKDSENLTITYEYNNDTLLSKEKWSVPSKGEYLIYTYHYNNKGQVTSVDEEYGRNIQPNYKVYLYNSNVQIEQEITYADKTLTDSEVKFKYKRNQLIKQEVRLGTVYGNERSKGAWIEYRYFYNPDNTIKSIHNTYFDDDEGDLIIISDYYYKNGEKERIEKSEIKKGVSIIKTSYYFTYIR